ncbi:hypothetical protein EDC48_10526 [Gibbsiella quercinecans]|nr:hypothetical protein EDC48_10526 [Gibbsiella quercinecans]
MFCPALCAKTQGKTVMGPALTPALSHREREPLVPNISMLPRREKAMQKQTLLLQVPPYIPSPTGRGSHSC